MMSLIIITLRGVPRLRARLAESEKTFFQDEKPASFPLKQERSLVTIKRISGGENNFFLRHFIDVNKILFPWQLQSKKRNFFIADDWNGIVKLQILRRMELEKKFEAHFSGAYYRLFFSIDEHKNCQLDSSSTGFFGWDESGWDEH
jgi:hypothetical protein